MTNLAVLDLFAGAGGFSLGAHAITDDVWGIELDADAVATQGAAGMRNERADITTLDPHDYADQPRYRQMLGDTLHIHASPPCQSFSVAGKGDGRKHLEALGRAAYYIIIRGDHFEDLSEVPEGSLLVLEPARWIHALRPDSISMEQVRSVLPIWESYAAGLKVLGYQTWTALLYSEQYGVPQTRTRAWLGASLRQDSAGEDADLSLVLNLGDRRTVVGGAGRVGDEFVGDPHLVPFSKIHAPDPTHSRYHVRNPAKLDAGLLPWVSMAEALGWEGDDLAGFPRRTDGRGAVTTIDGIDYRSRDLRQGDQPAFGLTEKARSWTHMMQGGAGGEGRPRPVDQPAPTQSAKGTATVTDDPDNNWHGKENKAARVAGEGGKPFRDPGTTARRVTVEEAGILQGFPADFPWQGSKTSQFRQVGNAVNPAVAEAVLRSVL